MAYERDFKRAAIAIVLNKKLKSQIDDESTGEPRNDIIKAIIRHVTKNQYDQKLGQLIQTAEGRFNHISRQQEFDQLCKDQRQASDEVVESFLKKKQIDPNVIYRTAKQQVERDDIVERWAREVNPDGRGDRVAALKEKAATLLPEAFESPVVSHDVTAEVQQEVQQEVQKEKEKQTQSFNIQSKPNHTPVLYKDVFGSIESINKVGKTLKCEPPFSEDETALFTIKASGNFQTVATLYSSRTPAGLKNQTQLPCRHIVMYKDEDGKTKGIMLHNIDVEMLMDDYSPNATVSAILDGSNEDDQGMPINEYGILQYQIMMSFVSIILLKKIVI